MQVGFTPLFIAIREEKNMHTGEAWPTLSFIEGINFALHKEDLLKRLKENERINLECRIPVSFLAYIVFCKVQSL